MSEVVALSHEEMDAVWRDAHNGLQWNCLFMLPAWIKAWWEIFGTGEPMRLLVTGENGKPFGLALFKRQGETASFLGSADVCDYQDVVVAPGRESFFFDALLGYLQNRGVTRLDLTPVRPDAAAGGLVAAASRSGYRVQRTAEDVSVTLELPDRWEAYLSELSGKQRHEIRRKIRRLHEAGPVSLHVVENRDEIRQTLPVFLQLFRTSRPDKADFMTARMERFFRLLADTLSQESIIKLYLLTLAGRTVAAVICFDFGSTTYLYNSGYDLRYRSLSVGMLSKVFSLKQSIDEGKKQFDLLKGGEPYKYRLGGKPLRLYRYGIELHKPNGSPDLTTNFVERDKPVG